MNLEQKNPSFYNCKLCDYNTSNYKDYKKHLTTTKHLNRTNLEQDWGQIEALMNHLTGLDPKYLHPTDEMFLKWFDQYEKL